MQTIDLAVPGDADVPLVVDLDGTLIRSDLLVESFFSLLSRRPIHALRAAMALREGKAALKAKIADQSVLDLKSLPFNDDLIAYIRQEKARGRKIYLASASDRRYVEALAADLGLFDGVFASDGTVNLAGSRKAQLLCDTFGIGQFDYAGNSAADLEVWQKARGVLVVGASPRLTRQVMARFPHAQDMGGGTVPMTTYLRAIRIHQWLKNLLIFVPAFAAHEFGSGAVLSILLAFFSFSFCASSAYLLNDLLDLRNDRQHPTKRLRPFASGKVPITQGIGMSAGLLGAALLIGLFLPLQFLGLLAVYYALTMTYSLWLKRKMTVDVLTLACLYGMRLLAGGAAAAVPLSPWLVAFSIFLFLSFAIIKRCTELIGRIEAGKGDPPGRGYRLMDLPALEGMAAASGYVAVMVFTLYINSPAVVALYSAPERLWLICIILIYVISRMLMLTHRGEMHDDPIVFAARDRISLISAALMAAVVVVSI